MNNEKNKLIEMLGKNVEIKDINIQNITNDVLCGKLKLNNTEIYAYIIGENSLENYQRFEGKIVSIIELREKNELRIVITKKESKISYAEVTGYFRNITELKNAKYKCLFEKSAGVIAYKKINGEPHYLITYSKKNFSGFPKGHVEYGEKEEDTAKREVFEEAGIKVELKKGFRESISYTVFDTPIQKEVVFFLGEMAEDETVNINTNEISKFEIVTFDKAKNILNEELMNVLKIAKEYIEKN